MTHPSEPTAPRQLYAPLPLPAVSFDDQFWAPRRRVNRERTLPHIYAQCAATGRIDAFRRDWQPAPEHAQRNGRWQGSAVMFWDSDVAKWIEAAAYSLATDPDPQLDAQLDALIATIAGIQQPDGYLNTWFTHIDPAGRWSNLRDWHELYCAGHLIEAAVAHYEATGKRALLDVLCRYADYIGATFGAAPGQRRGYCGHPEIELALIRLAQATGEPRYMALSRYFVNERGRQPHYFDQEALARGADPAEFWAGSHEYNQSHLPVREQHEAVGHAVRAMYLYSAMADLAAIDGDAALGDACARLWRHLTGRRMYVMGGIGTSGTNEGFTSDYDLPNESAYAETCAAIGLIFWARRMLQLGLDRRYADVLELALYNAALSGVSLGGDAFFYENPLASRGRHHREPWFSCPCCPPNLARLVASLGAYAYAQGESEAVVHLYAQGSAQFHFGGAPVTLQVQTDYPWDGRVVVRVAAAQPVRFALRMRLPGWCAAPQVALNGGPLNALAEHGYLRIEREWRNGDEVALELPMPIERLYADPRIAADLGCVALRRGPLLYCIEQADHAVPIERIVLPDTAELSQAFHAELLGGVAVISGAALAASHEGWDEGLYRAERPALRPCALTAIPYYAWDHRAPGAMRVWLPSAP